MLKSITLLSNKDGAKYDLYSIKTTHSNEDMEYIFNTAKATFKLLPRWIIKDLSIFPKDRVRENSELAIIYIEKDGTNYVTEIMERAEGTPLPVTQYSHVKGYVKVFDDSAKDEDGKKLVRIVLKDRKGEEHEFNAYQGITEFTYRNQRIQYPNIYIEDYIGVKYYTDEENNKIAVELVGIRPYRDPPEGWTWD